MLSSPCDGEGGQTSVLCGFETPIFMNCFEQVLQQEDFQNFCFQISFQTFTIKYGRARKYLVSICVQQKHCSKVEINDKNRAGSNSSKYNSKC